MQLVQFTAARADTGAALPHALVTVYQAGTTTYASLFNASGAGIANPTTAGATGGVAFAASDGNYDISISSADGSYTAPLIGAFQIVDVVAMTALISGILNAVEIGQGPPPAAGTWYLSGGVLMRA